MRSFRFLKVLIIALLLSLGLVHAPSASAFNPLGNLQLPIPKVSKIPAPSQDLNYLPSFTYLEQKVNDKVENTKEFASILDAKIPAKYRPESRGIFPIRVYTVPLEDVVVINAGGVAPKGLIKKTGSRQYVQFLVHPLSEEIFAPYLKKYPYKDSFSATPLSSYRALIVWPTSQDTKDYLPVMNIKLSLNAEIGSTVRMLSRSQIERASVVSFALQKADHKAFNQEGIYFIDEPFSVYLKSYQYGYTYRTLPKLDPKSQLVPMFSLYARKNREQSMLEKLIAGQDKNARDYVRENIMEPLLKHMISIALTEGFIGEPHEQNVMLEVREGKLTGRFYYRDLAGFHLSPELREAAGKDLKFIPKKFSKDSLKLGRANLIDNLKNYLVESNFYAMRAAVKDVSSITKQWVEETSLKIVEQELLRRTGIHSSSWETAKSAVTKYAHKGGMKCSMLFAN